MTPADVKVVVDRLGEYETLQAIEAILIGHLAGDRGIQITEKVLRMDWQHITTRTKASILADVTERLNQLQAELQLMGVDDLPKRSS